MNEKNGMTRITLQMPCELLEDLKILAQGNGMSVSALLRYLAIKEIQKLSSDKN